MNVEHKEYTGKGQGNYNSVGASAGIASFLGLNADNILGRGCNNNRVHELYAENSQLKAEKHADNRLDAYNANLMEKWFKPIADEVADSRVREARMEEQIKCIEKTHALELALAKQEAKCCCDKVNARVDCIEKTLSGIVVVKVSAASVEKAA